MTIKAVLATKSPEVSKSYQICSDITRAASTSFYRAFQMLPPAKRVSVYAIYAFCRLCDDAVDDPANRPRATDLLNELEHKALESTNGSASDSIWPALADTVHLFGVEVNNLKAVVDGCRMDLHHKPYADFAELEVYCSRVGGAVGLACMQIFGCERNSESIQHALKMGTGMQLCNITRDVAEDAHNGRTYIPQDELARFGVRPEDLLANEMKETTRGLIKFQAQRARGFLQYGNKLLPRMGPSEGLCIKGMVWTYSRILASVEANDYDVLSKRGGIRKKDKILLSARFAWERGKLVFTRS